MNALLGMMELRHTVDLSEVEAWSKAALDGLRKEPGFRGLLVLREGNGATACVVILWETKEHLLAARISGETLRRQNDLVPLLATPLKQRACDVVLDVRH